MSRLVDTTRRNNLLFFIPEKSGKVFDIRLSGEDAVRKLMDLESIQPLKNISPEVAKKQTSLFRQIYRRARSNQEERSIQTLFVAHGLFRWPSEDGGREFCAPALLFPVEVSTDAGNKNRFKIELTGEVELNRPLLVLWKQQYGIDTLSVESLTELADPEGTTEQWRKSIDCLLNTLSQLSAGINGIKFEEGAWLSNFSFQKLGLVQDLESYKNSSYAHPIVAALCGDENARDLLLGNRPDFTPSEIDDLPAGDDFTFLPCDSSQFTVIRNVLNGRNGVIQGPPGTGKSQTIANLIAELVARGKKVLFVAEKKAALDVVFDRLNKAGLGDMILNLHGGDMRGKKLSAQLSKGLEVLRSPAADWTDGTLIEWENVRNDLAGFVKLMHTPWEPWNISPYSCMDWLMGHPAIPHPGIRIQSSSLEKIGPDLKRKMMNLLDEYGSISAKMASPQKTGWKDAVSLNGIQTHELFELVQDIQDTLKKATEWYVTNAGINHVGIPEDLNGYHTQRDFLKLVSEIAVHFKPGALGVDCSEEISMLSGYKDKPLGRFTSGLFSSSYNKALKKIEALFSGRVEIFGNGWPLLEQQQKIREYWKGTPPEKTQGVNELDVLLRLLDEKIHALSACIPAVLQMQKSGELLDFTGALLSNREQAYLLPKLLELKKELSDTGLDTFVAQCVSADIAQEKWSASFEQLYHRGILEIMKSRDMRLAAFDGRRHDEKRKLFRELDKKRQTMAISRIRRVHAERMTKLLNTFPDQERAIRSQSQRKYPWPFRRIFRTGPDVLLSVFPCWMASPLTVTQFIEAGSPAFDVVFFDEASQVQPEDSISSILRGKQLVVSGDTRQLPPTSFFADGDSESVMEDSQDQPATGGYESLLHLMLGTLPGLGPSGDGWFLQWHYRSRDESLIAFSNVHIYNNRMVTFPKPSGGQAVHFVRVDPSVKSDVGQESVTAEVQRVTELALEISQRNPEKSLGIIALGIEHASRLEEAIESALENAGEETKAFFSENRKEPFFVKNLERVQGDERDIVILSIGYGQNRTGSLSHNFGPINQDGGERRLNVAITRSRQEMWVVASFDPAELNPERTKGAGPELLRKYLLYAKSGGRDLGLERPTGAAENFFERDIRMALNEKGMQITPQYGVSGYRIDLVVHHPEKPGEFIMAIECDGAAYHSSPCARDRDRLRQEFLEGMGWKFHRIWSTDWFTGREEEIERAVQRYNELLAEGRLKKPEDKITEKSTKDVSWGKPPSQSPLPPDTPVRTRGERPPVPKYDSIGDYADRELFLLAQWILSDGVLRTDQLLFEDLFDELGFKRKGNAITARLQDIIARMKQ